MCFSPDLFPEFVKVANLQAHIALVVDLLFSQFVSTFFLFYISFFFFFANFGLLFLIVLFVNEILFIPLELGKMS